MKLVHKITLANVVGVIAIILVASFSYQEFNLLLTKLHFVEIADVLNTSFLEMRLSEKNYLLYQDHTALLSIKQKIQKSHATLRSMAPDIVKAIGTNSYDNIESSLKRYEEVIDEAIRSEDRFRDSLIVQEEIRMAGRALRLFSAKIVKDERKKVDEIISASKKTLLSFFAIVIVAAIVSNYFFFSNMFKNLHQIEKTANSISKGEFKKIEGKIPDNELGDALKAINSMSEELKTSHEQLIQSRKLASLGTLTAGVAHELGNPLNNISMVAQTFLELFHKLPDEEKIEYIQIILDESERIKKIVQDLLDFSRTKERNFKVCDINGIVKRSLKLVQNMLDISGLNTRVELKKNLPPVFVDEDKIREVLVNLLTNAIHATKAGDTISLRTELSPDEKYVQVEVEDTGKGIPQKFLTRIFDPFFSTKGTDGTGLGLSISYGIIKKHKGTIEVESTVGKGTIFRIKLPIYLKKEDENERAQNNGDR